jgi:phosphatidylglycerophosphate synthase
MPDPHYAPERRPIASRERASSKAIAHWLVQRNATPNAISTAGMVVGLFGGFALAATSIPGWSRFFFFIGAVCIQLRLLANMLDGMVAIESGKASPVGELYNEVPDRVSDSASLIGAGFAAGSSPALGFLAALLAMFTAYVRAIGKGAGAKQEFCGPMAKPQRMFTLTVMALLNVVLPSGWLVWNPASAWGSLMRAGLILIGAGAAATAVRRLLRIAAQLRAGKGTP